ncbi:hypothetical protein Neosp_001558 [[Neocosmospora] mangrovei]
MRLYQKTGKLPCLPAHVMISMIALLFYRKIRLDTTSMKKSSLNVLELFGAHDTTKWLRVAILTSEQVGHKSFLVEVDHEMVVPQVRKEHSGSDNFSIVTTTEPPTHQYRRLVDSRFRHTRIQLLSSSQELLPSEDGSHRESIALTDTDDSHIEQVVTRSITRAQALERAGDLINQVRNPDFDQFALKDKMGLWLSEPVIRVLPMGLKKRLLLYCSDHLPDWSAKIKEHYFEDRDEHTWQETIQVAPAEQVYGKETLGSLLAKLKTIEAKIHPTELREAVTGLRRRIRPHGKYWDKLQQDMVSVLKGSGTSTAEQREALVEEMSQQREALDEERRDLDEKRSAFAQQQEAFAQQQEAFAQQQEAFAQQQEAFAQQCQTLDRDLATFAQQRQTFADEMSQQRQTVERNLEALVLRRQALEDTSDLETLWEWFLSSESTIPPCLRIVVRTRCSWDTLQRLSDLENAQNAQN